MALEKIDLIQQFSHRLKDAMIACGYHSSRSTSGVDIHKLVEMTGYSPQICRKYLRGEVIPEPAKLTELAAKLNVSPGWLLFGDSHSNAGVVENKITISNELLHYIFAHASQLYTPNQSPSEAPDFLLNLTREISQIETSEDQSKKIIDLALSSANHFKRE
jgi:transcriptional regulator with XRE-family HTH domain